MTWGEEGGRKGNDFHSLFLLLGCNASKEIRTPMNAVEIEEAVTALAEQPYDANEFPFSFLQAFGNSTTTVNRLRSDNSNKSDVPGGVLQRSNIHLAVSDPGNVANSLSALRDSPKTSANKCKFILATDGEWLEGEDLNTGETVACKFEELPDHFGFFLALAGISTVQQIRDNPIDVRATSRLNQLYVELLSENPDWESEDGRHNMNHFMAKLIFCFFAEDTGIFLGENLFTDTIDQMSDSREGNIDFVIRECFRAMDTKVEDRAKSKLPRWADAFPYVNGELFGGENLVPNFTRKARSYLIHAGRLDWQAINPDIFGSMIQAIAEDEERGKLGMHYTSVPNILKVLNPLFLDDLREQLETAGDNARKLLNLRNRIAKIRVFDPACGSGNFLVIAYKQMREIEFEVNKRRGEAERRSDIPLTNFRGIEIRDFACEVARLALIIAEYQCDVEYRDQKSALAEFLPLDSKNWITCGNALRLDWLSICPPTGEIAKIQSDDLFETPLDQSEIDFENEGGETYICGNPPYKGARKQEHYEKEDLKRTFHNHPDYKDADYVAGWFLKAFGFLEANNARFAFVATSSICQGEQVQFIWPRMWAKKQELFFAHTPFKWQNPAAQNAGVFVTIVGGRHHSTHAKYIFEDNTRRRVGNITPYLTAGEDLVVRSADKPISPFLSKMIMGNMARDDGHLILSPAEAQELLNEFPSAQSFLSPLLGTKEIVGGKLRFALHLKEENRDEWSSIPPIQERVERVRKFRLGSKAKTTNGYAAISHRFAQYCHKDQVALAFPSVTPADRSYSTPILIDANTMVTNLAYVVYGFSMYEFSLASSLMHLVWTRSVSGRLGSGVRYTPSICFHPFPAPTLTQKNKQDLTKCAEDILLARESHFPKTIADLYKPEDMPEDLRAAHERNDEVLERIYIGRRFKNDTERLEKLFELYSKMIAAEEKGKHNA